MFSIDEKIEIVKLYKENNSMRGVRDLFSAKYPNRPIPSTSTIFKIINAFNVEGCIRNENKKRERSCSVLSDEMKLNILCLFEEEPATSLNTAAKTLDVSRSSIYKTLKEFKYTTCRYQLQDHSFAIWAKTNDDFTEMKRSAIVPLCTQETLAGIDTNMFDIKIKFEEGETNIVPEQLDLPSIQEELTKSTITDDEPLTERKPSSDVLLCSQETLADDKDMLDNIKMEFDEGETHIVSGTESIDWQIDDIKMMKNDDDLQSETIIVSAYIEDRKPDDIKDDLMHDKIDLENNPLITDNEQSICSVSDETEQTIYPCEEYTTNFTVANDVTSGKYRKLTMHKCAVCNKEVFGAWRLTKHMQIHHGHKSHVCKQCGKHFQCASDLTQHLWTHNDDRKPFACKLCKARFRESFTLAEHMREHRNREKFTCTTSSKSFSDHITLLSHNNADRRTCSVCSKKLSCASTLALHMKTHPEREDYVCSHCEKRCKTASILKVHERMHTGENLHMCNVCNMGCVSRHHLSIHLRTHTGEKPFVCGKGCVTSSQLRRHMRLHTGEKLYHCHLCSKMFAHDHDLVNHIKGHTGVRDHICAYCGKGFYEAARLKKHLRVHTGVDRKSRQNDERNHISEEFNYDVDEASKLKNQMLASLSYYLKGN